MTVALYAVVARFPASVNHRNTRLCYVPLIWTVAEVGGKGIDE